MALNILSTYPFPQHGLECYYHIDSAEHALDDIKNHHIIGSIPSHVNDEEDLKIDYLNLKNSVYLSNSITFWSQIQQQHFYVRNLGKDKKKKKKIEQSVQTHARITMNNVLRCVCMAAASKVDVDLSSQVMFWNKYASEFAGVRFKFRVDCNFLLQPSGNETFFDAVVYDEGTPPVLDFSAISDLADMKNKMIQPGFLNKLLYNKNIDNWGREYEYRFVSILNCINRTPAENGGNYFFDFNPDNLLRVDIGEKADQRYFDELRRELRKLGVPVQIARQSVRYL